MIYQLEKDKIKHEVKINKLEQELKGLANVNDRDYKTEQELKKEQDQHMLKISEINKTISNF